MVGGNIGLARLFYMGYGNKNWTGKDVQQLRDESIARLEAWSQKEGTQSEDISKFITELRNSDWSNQESFQTFKTTVFDPYTAPEQDAVQEIRDSFFGKGGLK